MRLTRLAQMLAALIVAGGGTATACAICLSAVSVTVGERLDSTDAAVLAAPDGHGLRVLAAIKGGFGQGAVIPAEALVPEIQAPGEGRALLLAHNALAGTWTSLGATDPANAAWLRQVTATGGEPRMVLVAPRLEDPDPLVAEIAHNEVARSSYTAMGGLAHRIDPDRLRTWVADPDTGTRRATYILLLGKAGGAGDAAAIEAHLAEARQSEDATDVAAMLAADLELRGASRIAWLEKTYLTDPSRSLPEIEAALLALAIHGDADDTVPRDRVVAAYLDFIRARPPMAGFVAPELAEWNAWEATRDYAALIESGAVTDPAEEFAILAYLQQSPDLAGDAILADE